MNTQDCVISGGGPAGIMLGLILARAGVKVTVLEKHADFLRDFRGDTVHPATIRVLDELGLGEKFRALPQSKLGNVGLPDGRGNIITFSDFDSLAAPYNYVAMVPQWDLLNLLVEAANEEPSFTLLLNTKATWLTMEDGTVTGVSYENSDGESGEISALLTVACDGRHSTTRAAAGLQPFDYPVSFDTWWFRLSRKPEEQDKVGMLIPRASKNGIALSLSRPTYYQIAYFDAKGADSKLRRDGLEVFKERIAHLMPEYADRIDEITSFADLHQLDVKLNRLKKWYRPGFIALGDAAHAMSPAGGVGINLAIQDAVAAGRILAPALKRGKVPISLLASIQRRRWAAMAVIQLFQRMLHKYVFTPAVTGTFTSMPRPALWAAKNITIVRKIMPRLVGFGVTPEHAPFFARRATNSTSQTQQPYQRVSAAANESHPLGD